MDCFNYHNVLYSKLKKSNLYAHYQFEFETMGLSHNEMKILYFEFSHLLYDQSSPIHIDYISKFKRWTNAKTGCDNIPKVEKQNSEQRDKKFLQIGMLLFLLDGNLRIRLAYRIFSLFDSRKSARIDFAQFVMCLWNYCTLSNDDMKKFLFDLYSSTLPNGSRGINVCDLCSITEELMGNFSHKQEVMDWIKNLQFEMMSLNVSDGFIDITGFHTFLTRFDIIMTVALELQSSLLQLLIDLPPNRNNPYVVKRKFLSNNHYIPIQILLRQDCNWQSFDLSSYQIMVNEMDEINMNATISDCNFIKYEKMSDRNDSSSTSLKSLTHKIQPTVTESMSNDLEKHFVGDIKRKPSSSNSKSENVFKKVYAILNRSCISMEKVVISNPSIHPPSETCFPLLELTPKEDDSSSNVDTIDDDIIDDKNNNGSEKTSRSTANQNEDYKETNSG
eukprot:gene9568-12888_t